jgi:hypothetical protein
LGYGVEFKTPCWGIKFDKLKTKINTHAPRSLFMYSPKLIDFFTVLGERKLPPYPFK